MLTRRHFSQQLYQQGAAGVLTGLAAPFAVAQNPTLGKLLIGIPAGTPFDAFARRVAEKLRGNLAANVIVENKTGAGGQIAISALKDSAADGSNLLLSPSGPLTIFPHTYAKLPYTLSDVTPVATSVFVEPCIAVGPVVPESVKNFKQFLVWLKQNPAQATYGSPGAGSMLHLVGEYVSKQQKTEWRHAPYRGAGPAVQDMMGGQVAAVIAPIGSFLPFLKSGKVRILALSSKVRNALIPEVPTLRESGIALDVREWYGFYMPSATPADVVRRTAAYLQVVLTHPEMVAWTATMAMTMQYKGPAETAALLQSDTQEWQKLVKATGFKAD